MDWILFLIGGGLIYLGKIEVGNLRAEGSVVRAAGFLLMIPAIAGIILRVAYSAISGSVAGGETFITIILLATMVICVGAAYTLLSRNSVKDHFVVTPKDEGDKQDEPPKVTRQPSEFWKQSRPRRDYPTVMGTAEAAKYLNMNERDLLKLIDEGKIPAAKINARYRISRSVLDDFIEQQSNNNSSSPASEV